MKHKWIIAPILLVFFFLGVYTNAVAAISFEKVPFYTETRSTWGGSGWRYQFGAIVVDDDYDIASVIARSVTTADVFVLSDLVTITGEWVWGYTEITGLPWLDQLEIIATNTNGESSSVFTSILDKEQRLGYPSNITISDNSLTPTFSWDSVLGAEKYRVRIYNSSNQRIFDSWGYNGYQDFTDTFYTIPGGILSEGESYRAMVIANDIDPDNVNGGMENRSSVFYSFTPVPIPTAIFLLGSGLVGLAGFRRKFKK